MPDVSVIIPAKLRTPAEVTWLGEAIASVRKQGKDIPIIVANDKSLVDWKEVEKSIDLSGVQVIPVPEGHRGAAAGRNVALSQVKTRFTVTLDADDYLADNAFDLLFDAFPGKGYIYGAFVMFSEKGFAKPFYQEHTPNLLIRYQHFIPSGVLQPTEDIRKVGGWDETPDLIEDWDFFLTCMEQGICATGTPETTVYYRQHNNSTMASLHRQKGFLQNKLDVTVPRHKKLFSGDIKMCCGHKINPRPARLDNLTPARVKAPLVPKGGMIMLNYIGAGNSTRTWWGQATGTRYRFGGQVKTGYVYETDIPSMLKISEYGHLIFAKAE